MKRRRIVLFLLCSVAATILAIFLWPREREPEYDGVPLSEWIDRYQRSTHSIHSMDASEISSASKAKDAIQHMGTNSLPFLVRWIEYERPGWKKCLYDASWKLPQNIHNGRTLIWLLGLGDKKRRADNAVEAFAILKAKAEPVAPELKRLWEKAEKFSMHDTSRRALDCLYLISHDPLYDKPGEGRPACSTIVEL